MIGHEKLKMTTIGGSDENIFAYREIAWPIIYFALKMPQSIQISMIEEGLAGETKR